MKVIYSNCEGSHVIEKGIVETLKFKDPVESCLKIEKNELLDEEKKLKEKYPDAILIKELEKSKIGDILSIFTERSNEFFETELKVAKRKIKESVKFDNLLINASDLTDEMNKSINLLSRRLREWFELSNPEVSRKIEDNVKFAKKVIEGNLDKSEMGAELKDEDLEPINELARQIVELDESKQKQEKYIDEVMKNNCPNVQAVAGSNIGAKLIALAGSFRRMTMLPSSTIQILGAEKALFRHIKTGAKSPKHGIIINHQLVAYSKNKGMVSRQLADKISIAARIDYFKGEFIGDRLLEELKKKIGEKDGS